MIGNDVSTVPGSAAERDRRTRGRRPRVGEVLDLPLAVDRGIGDDGDGLLEVVGEILALGRKRGERAVVAERADRLSPVGGHLLDQLDVVALPAEAGEHVVGDLHRLLGTGVGIARDLLALERAAGLERPVETGRLVVAGAGEPAVAHDAQHLGVRVERRVAALAVDRARAPSRPGASGFGSATISPDRHDAGLRGEDERVTGLDLPQRAQPERVGGEHAFVPVAGDQRDRPLGERPHRLAQVHVEAVQVLRQRA